MLYDNWQSKQKWLESTYLEQVFYRDTEYMEKITNSQEVSAPINYQGLLLFRFQHLRYILSGDRLNKYPYSFT